MSQPLPKGGDENGNGKGQKKVSNKKVSNKKGEGKKGKAAAKLSAKKR